ncbi:uncharacterized protein LOC110016122 isoform X2 [Oryzias latipes]|uniref:uncharacterized protein LOC110016122 isoform X2 n=1 Tax=Oryzias latipes TaxID=8090 RepID=UPI000CE1C29D|nr:uncharacterized protein LOC110016122 isoform X2 [Oryzias latipes]
MLELGPEGCTDPGDAGWSPNPPAAVQTPAAETQTFLLTILHSFQVKYFCKELNSSVALGLNLVRAGNPLEYSGCYHSATYTLRQPTSCQDLPVKNGILTENVSSIQTVTAVTPAVSAPALPSPVTPQLCLPLPSHPVLPPPPLHAAPFLPSTPRVLSFPFPLPVIGTTPPSPHLSWGACSDVDVYSRIGAFRPSRLSSLSSQSTVILFEHSAL